MNLGSTCSFVEFLVKLPCLVFLIDSLYPFFLSPSFLFFRLIFSNHLHPPPFLHFLSFPLFLFHFLSPTPSPLNLRFIPVSSVLCTLSTAKRGSWIRTVYPHPTLPLVLLWPHPKTRSGEKLIERDVKHKQSNEDYSTIAFCVSKLESCFFPLVFFFLLFSCLLHELGTRTVAGKFPLKNTEN